MDWIYLAHDKDHWRALVNGGEFIDLLSDYQLPKKDPAPWNHFVSKHKKFYRLKYVSYVTIGYTVF
jgi:hypothetical protein